MLWHLAYAAELLGMHMQLQSMGLITFLLGYSELIYISAEHQNLDASILPMQAPSR